MARTYRKYKNKPYKDKDIQTVAMDEIPHKKKKHKIKLKDSKKLMGLKELLEDDLNLTDE